MAGLREPLFPLRPRRERAVLDGYAEVREEISAFVVSVGPSEASP